MHSNAKLTTSKLMLVPQGEFALERYPPERFLRAWDAADEYLLRQIAEQSILSRHSSVLVANDSFGALSVALAEHAPMMMSDSYLAQLGR